MIFIPRSPRVPINISRRFQGATGPSIEAMQGRNVSNLMEIFGVIHETRMEKYEALRDTFEAISETDSRAWSEMRGAFSQIGNMFGFGRARANIENALAMPFDRVSNLVGNYMQQAMMPFTNQMLRFVNQMSSAVMPWLNQNWQGAGAGGLVGSILGSFFGPAGTILGGILFSFVGAGFQELFSPDPRPADPSRLLFDPTDPTPLQRQLGQVPQLTTGGPWNANIQYSQQILQGIRAQPSTQRERLAARIAGFDQRHTR